MTTLVALAYGAVPYALVLGFTPSPVSSLIGLPLVFAQSGDQLWNLFSMSGLDPGIHGVVMKEKASEHV